MKAAPDSKHPARTDFDRARQSLPLIILLDLVTMGLYSIGRSYIVHAAITRKTGRRFFHVGFLHILVLLHLALVILAHSRRLLPPDFTVLITQGAASVLAISVLLVFRRYLAHEFGLRLQTLPLGVFGFWYMQFHINRFRSFQSKMPVKEHFWITPLAIFFFLALSFLPLALKVDKIASVSMEPSLPWRDSVLVDQVSYLFFYEPRRADLLVYRSPSDEKKLNVSRLIGLPGDRIAFGADGIWVNDELIACQTILDQLKKKSYGCELSGQKFRLLSSGGFQQAQARAFEVPFDHYFVLGDNLDNIADSRTIGPIARQSVTGRVLARMPSFPSGGLLPFHRRLPLLK